MMEAYLILLAAIPAISRLLPRRWAVPVLTAMHLLLCGLRHPHLTGDLMKYHWQFLSGRTDGWKNFGFSWLMAGISRISGGNYQLFLFLIAAVFCGAAGYLIGKYCDAPWLGFWAFDCLGLYIGSFSAIKQALAMGLILLAYTGIETGNFRRFLILTLLAGAVHLPALIFLGAYGLTRLRFDGRMAAAYLLAGAAIWLLREPVTAFAGGLYYETWTLPSGGGSPGGRFFLMVLLLAAGLLLRGWEADSFSRLAHLMAAAALLQLLAVYGNVFTRLADYYFQFAILFLPNMLAKPERAVLNFDGVSRKQLALAGAVCLGLFYWVAYLNVPAAYETDNYVNYGFFWEAR